MPLGTLTSSDFDEGSSVAACEMYNMTKHAISSSVQGDLIQCYVANMVAPAVEHDLLDSDLYDGEYHVLSLDFTGALSEGEGEGGGGPDKIKMKVEKDADGNITSFEMFACQDGTQNMYLLQTIDGTDFNMVVKESSTRAFGEGVNRTHQQHVIVEGTLNEDGQFVDSADGEATPKRIYMRFNNSTDDDSEDFYGSFDFHQYSDHATLDGTMSGSHMFGDTETTFTNVLFSSMQLLDGNTDGEDYDIGLLALGDGAATQRHFGTFGGVSYGDSTPQIEAWLGDTIAALEDPVDSAFYTDVSSITLEAQEAAVFEFETAEQMDCTAAAEASIALADVNEAAGVDNVFAACSTLEMNHSHIDCYQLIHEGRTIAE